VLTAAECQTVISRRAIDCSWAFVQYSMRSVERLVRGDDTASGKAPKTLPELIRGVLTRHGGSVDKSSLLRSLGPRATADSLRAAVDGMADVELVKGETASGKGRPPSIYRLVTTAGSEPMGEERPVTEPATEEVPEQASESASELALSSAWL